MNREAIINPLKGKTDNGWHFEQAVFSPVGIARTLKAGDGTGNIPKVIEIYETADNTDRDDMEE